MKASGKCFGGVGLVFRNSALSGAILPKASTTFVTWGNYKKAVRAFEGFEHNTGFLVDFVGLIRW